jgi:hypothetical protein
MIRNLQQRTLGSLQQLSAALAANSASLTNLEAQRQQFEDMVAATLEAFTRQSHLTAEKQEASQTLKTLLTEASRHATVLRLAVKAHYGIRSEKLVEFGLKPLRSRKPAETAKPGPDPNPDPDPDPVDPGPTIE